MDLVSPEQPFKEAHPIVDFFTDPNVFVMGTCIILGVFLLVGIICLMFLKSDTVFIINLFITFGLVLIWLLLTIVVFGSYRQHVESDQIYKGQVQVKDMTTVDSNFKRGIKLSDGTDIVRLKVSKDQLENVKKGDTVTMKIKYNKINVRNLGKHTSLHDIKKYDGEIIDMTKK